MIQKRTIWCESPFLEKNFANLRFILALRILSGIFFAASFDPNCELLALLNKNYTIDTLPSALLLPTSHFFHFYFIKKHKRDNHKK